MTFDPKQTVPFEINRPPMQVAVITVRAVEGETETGGWCQQCALPSVVTVHFSVVAGSAVIGRLRAWVCDSCGREGTIRGQ